MSNKFTGSREQIKAHIEAFQPLAGVPVFIERAGVDIDEEVEAALNGKGLAVVVLSVTAGIIDQIRQGAVVMRATVPVCVLENVARNMANADAAAGLPAGWKISSEDMVQHIIRALLGKEVGDGCATLTKDAFARGGDDAGLIENYIGFDIPVALRGVPTPVPPPPDAGP